MKTIRPFAAPEFTPFKNDALDYIMPRVSGSAWKVLCVAIRKTWGWADDQSPTGRKQWDTISYSQFRDATGIKGRSTLSRALTECLKAGYLLRRPLGDDPRAGFTYTLNVNFELPSPKMGLASGPKMGPDDLQTGPKMGHTKEIPLNKEIKKDTGADAPAAAARAEDEKDQVHPVNTPSKKPRRSKAKSQAVKLFHTTFKLWPTTKQQEMIDGQVQDVQHWKDVLEAWAGQGHKPLNITGQLDWYRDGIPDHARRGGKRKHASKERRPDDYTAGEYGDFVLA